MFIVMSLLVMMSGNVYASKPLVEKLDSIENQIKIIKSEMKTLEVKLKYNKNDILVNQEFSSKKVILKNLDKKKKDIKKAISLEKKLTNIAKQYSKCETEYNLILKTIE